MTGPWPVEIIPDDDHLYLRVHRSSINALGQPEPGAFRNRPDKLRDGMSTNWCRYATAEETRDQASSDLDDNAVLALPVRGIRAIPDQSVVHSPIFQHPTLPDNRAHADVMGLKTTKARLLYLEISHWALPMPPPANAK